MLWLTKRSSSYKRVQPRDFQVDQFKCFHYLPYFESHQSMFNPLILRAAKSSMTILMKSCRQKHTYENIWWRNVQQDITNNSPTNILRNHPQFQSYCQKYHRSRRQFMYVWVELARYTRRNELNQQNGFILEKDLHENIAVKSENLRWFSIIHSLMKYISKFISKCSSCSPREHSEK